MDPQTALLDAGGAARRGVLLAAGVSKRALSAAVSDGSVVSPAPGTYALHNTEPGIVAATALRGQLACVSACEWWGLRRWHAPDAIHIAVPSSRHVQEDRLRALGLRGVHRLDPEVPSATVESVSEAIDHAALCNAPLEQLVIVDSALNTKRVSKAELAWLSSGTSKRRKWIVANANSGAASVPETVARAVLTAAGFMPEVQAGRPGVGRVDLQLRKRYVLEVDGWESHSSKEAFAEDRRRDREVAAARDWTLRFTYWDVMRDPLVFAAEVARIVRTPLSPRFAARMRWMTARPAGHLNRRSR